ncbi:exodeoxyribonuclease V subunit beta [Aliidiomarina sp. Khilg15.8]
MSSTSVTLNSPLELPLRGSALIEASAGTGKTYTIAAVYVRFILGHIANKKGEQSRVEPILPPNILVVTFTKAATAELKDRIRQRLVEAAAWFRRDADAVADDKFLQQLRDEYAQDRWSACARALQVAAEWMDEASVKTIHSWCQTLLREHAFSSGSLFNQELTTELESLRLQATRDYWRNTYYPLEGDAFAQVVMHWATPEALLSAIRPLWYNAPEQQPEPLDIDALAERQAQRNAETRAELKRCWQRWGNELIDYVDDAEAAGVIAKPRTLNSKKIRKDLSSVMAWAEDSEALDCAVSDTLAGHLSEAGMAKLLQVEVPSLGALGQLQVLQQFFKQPPSIKGDLAAHAAQWIKHRFHQQMHQDALLGFDDIIKNTAAALSGDQGNALAEQVRTQFPVAMVDEFQDTDPDQYRIFDAIYQLASNDERSTVLLIGDPKQAIYAFRGADIYTYLQARADTQGRHFTLARNFRSTSAMVEASNQLFNPAETTAPGKAFLFAQAEHNPVPFVNVKAQGLSTQLQIDDQPLTTALNLWVADESDEKLQSKQTYLTTQAEASASYIVHLLNGGVAGKTVLQRGDDSVAVQTSDIAVLVNNRTEAAAIQQALQARRVPSVYLSDSNSVYDAPVALDILAILQACASPTDARLLLAALNTSLLDLELTELDLLRADDLLWEHRVEQFMQLAEAWRTQGVLAMLHQVLHQFDVPQRLSGEEGGQRVLTDVLHLAELLQQAASRLEGEQALLRFIHEQLFNRDDGSTPAEEHIVRLESDAQLVQIVTIHKSKGLEYPLVFLPFIMACRPQTEKDNVLTYHDEDGRLQQSLAHTSSIVEQADRERLGEDIRKLYVAVTRAKYACWLGIAPVKSWAESAMAYLAGGLDDLAGAVRSTWGDDSPQIGVQSLPPADAAYFEPAPIEVPERQFCSMPAGYKPEHWWIASYSALKYGGLREPESAQEANLRDEDDINPEVITSDTETHASGIHQLPRGAGPGTFLHNLLEDAADQGFAEVAEDNALREQLVHRRCRNTHWEEREALLNEWLAEYLSVAFPLPGGDNVALRDLSAYRAEPEFWFKVDRVGAVQVDNLVADQVLAAYPRPALQPNYLNGMFKGFIDLVFEYKGKYYVADYKSNYLGPDDGAYTEEAMREKILSSRYDLQYVLYTYALHKLLQVRLGDAYHYDDHIGGVLYLFLRGHQARSRGAFVDRPPVELIERLDALLNRREGARDE